jgi:hypothetical protein
MRTDNYSSFIMLVISLAIFVFGCRKDKDECKPNIFQVFPFQEKIEVFDCNNDETDYTYVFTKRDQIDSLNPICFFTAPIAFPTDEYGMRYILLGRFSSYFRDTLTSTLYKDTCNKVLYYDVKMIQRDTALWSNGGGLQHIFCSVSEIPADYQVEVKYKYVPLE